MDIKEKTTLDAWRSALKFVKDKGNNFIDEDKRICREVFNIYIEVLNPSKDVIKPIEIIEGFKKWFYPPLSEISNITLSKKLSPMYAYAYGPRIFAHNKKIDQINDFIIPLLKSNTTSRRAVVSIWMPDMDASVEGKDMPGILIIDFKLRKKKLNASMIIRSNDFFLGWPANIYQTHILQKYVCDKLNVEAGFIGVFSTSAHIFKDKFEEICSVIKSTHNKKKS